MRKFFLASVLVVLLSTLGLAQKNIDEYDKVEIFVGYSGASLVSDDDFEPIDNGINVSAVYNIHRYFGIKVDVSGTFKTIEGDYFSPFTEPQLNPPSRYSADHSLYNATIGVQFKNNKREALLKPFGHVLVGYGKHRDKFTTACPTGAICQPFNFDFNGVSLILGGGLDIKINRRIDVRVIQLDVNPIFYKLDQQNFIYPNTRFSSGIVFKF